MLYRCNGNDIYAIKYDDDLLFEDLNKFINTIFKLDDKNIIESISILKEGIFIMFSNFCGIKVNKDQYIIYCLKNGISVSNTLFDVCNGDID